MIAYMKKNKMPLLFGCTIILLGLAWYFLLVTPSSDGNEKKPDHLVEFQGSELEEQQAGQLVWRLTAEKIQIDTDTNTVYLTKPQAVIVDADGTEIHIHAETGIVRRNEQVIEIKPPVAATTDANDALQTDGAVYYNMSTRLISGGKVTINRHDGTTLAGDAFETNATLDNVTLTGHAKVTKEEGTT